MMKHAFTMGQTNVYLSRTYSVQAGIM